MAHSFMDAPIVDDDESDSVAELIAETFKPAAYHPSFDSDSKLSVDDGLYIVGSWAASGIREVGTSWSWGKTEGEKFLRKIDAKRKEDDLRERLIKRAERKERGRIAMELAAERKAAWQIRLATMPRKWDAWRDPTIEIEVGGYVDLPIPDGVNTTRWVQALAANFGSSRKTRSFRWNFRTLDGRMVRITKRERVYTLFERAAMGLDLELEPERRAA